MNRSGEARWKQTHCRLIQVQEKLNLFLLPLERSVKRISAAGTKSGDLDCDLELQWFIIQSELRWQASSVRDVGTHVTRASAPALRGTFASTKVPQNRLPSLHPIGFPLSILLHRNVGKTRYRSNRLPTTIALTFIAFGAAEREGWAA
ncbi:hypothetical protein [uncultured Desulfuromonas sp.]|uniref:hypothetical protein n=1 Tax=uncultured Desulfuromonas sp. TaxID=181013 RepID=UPI002AABA171|nr:hypothetical protein [uncultured Desulfuromonas sp.]